MPDLRAIDGLEPLAERFGQKSPPREREASAHEEDDRTRAALDTAEVHRGGEVAFALLQKLVLSATERRLFGAENAATRPTHPTDPFVHATPRTPTQVVASIQRDQRWLAAGHVGCDILLHAAFIEGLDQTEAILRDVDQEDARTHAWFVAVRSALCSDAD